MNRIDLVVVIDVKHANPNGNPDADNLPRTDPETEQGIITSVCLKRKIRNFIMEAKENMEGLDIYYKSGVVLNELNQEAYDAAGIKPEGTRMPKDAEKAREVTKFMTDRYWDVRTFGGVLSTGINCGAIKGPVQVSDAISKERVSIIEHSITRDSVTNEEDREKERTFGRKNVVTHGVYVATISFCPNLARKTGFSEEDYELLVEALKNLFRYDASSARPAGSMNVRKIIEFRHSSELGDAPAHKLHEAVVVESKVEEPHDFSDYDFSIDKSGLNDKVEVKELVE